MSSRFTFLRKNKFFETTALTGYSFISDSKSKIELIFWYGWMILFVSLTVRNVTRVLEYYWSNPTVTHAEISSNSVNASINNFNITLQMSLFEFDQTTLMMPLEHFQPWPDSLMNKPNFAKMEKEHVIYYVYSYLLITSIPNTIRKTINKLALTSTDEAITDPKWHSGQQETSWDDWFAKASIEGEEMEDIFKDYRDKTIHAKEPLDYETAHANLGQLDAALLEIAKMAWNETLLGLMHLKSESWGAELRDILRSVSTSLPKIVAVQTSVPGAKVELRDWEMDKDSQTLVFGITLPPKTSEIQLDVYSTRLSRFLFYLKAFVYHLYECWYWKAEGITSLHSTFDCINCYMFSETIYSMKTLAYGPIMKHYEETTKIFLDLESRVQLEPLRSYDVVMIPEGQLISNITDCYPHTFRDCMDICTAEKQQEQCDCIMWQLQYIDPSYDQLCSEPCAIDQSLCSRECQEKVEHSCEHSLVRFALSSTAIKHMQNEPLEPIEPIYYYGWYKGDSHYSKSYYKHEYMVQKEETVTFRPDLPILSAQIHAPRAYVFPKFIQTYEMTRSELIAHLGGAVDFWLGISVIGLMHLCVYTIKQIVHLKYHPNSKTAITARRLFSRKSPSASWVDEAKHRLKAARERGAQFEVLMEEHKRNKEKIQDGKEVSDEADKPGWWRQNQLFEQTYLSGFSFISESKMLVEVLFWYLTIAVFVALTVMNVTSAVGEYMEKPTKTTISTAVQWQNATVPNFTLSVSFSFIDSMVRMMTTGAPDYHSFCDQQSPFDMGFAMDMEAHEISNQITVMLEAFFGQQLGSIASDPNCQECEYEARIIRGNFLHMGYSIYDIIHKYPDQNMNEWLDKIEAVSAQTQWSTYDFYDYAEAFEETDHFIWIYAYMGMFALKAAQVGLQPPADIQKNYFWQELTSYTGKDAVPLDSAEIFVPPYNPMFNVSGLDDFHNGADKYLSRKIEASGGRVVLRDWEPNPEQQVDEYEFEVIVNQEQHDITIDTYSYGLARHLIQLESFLIYAADTMEKQANDSCQSKACRIFFACIKEKDEQGKMAVFDQIVAEVVIPLMEKFISTTTVRIEIPGAGQLLLESPYDHSVDLVAASRHVSELPICYVYTLETCINKCVLEQHHDLCQCSPWWLKHHTNTPLKMCDKPCEDVVESDCETSCDKLIAHPCSSVLYRMQHSKDIIRHYSWAWNKGRPVINGREPLVKIRIKTQGEHIYPIFVEMYKMTLSDLMAHLGGVLEFWLGISVVAIIHLFVYTIKQCFHAANPASRTGEIIRKIGRRR